MVMSPKELSFLYAMKRGGLSKEWKGVVIGHLWLASGDRLTAQLLPECLADIG